MSRQVHIEFLPNYELGQILLLFHGDALALSEQDGVLLVELQHYGRLLLILPREFLYEGSGYALVVEGEDERAHELSLHVLDLYLLDLLEQEADVAGQVVGGLVAGPLVDHSCGLYGAVGDNLVGGEAEVAFGLDGLAVHRIIVAIKLEKEAAIIRCGSGCG